MPRLERTTADPDLAGVRRQLTGEHVEQLVLSLTLERRDAEDLSRAQRERDVLHVLHGQRVDLERRRRVVCPARRRVRVALDRLAGGLRGFGPEHVLDDSLLAALLWDDRRDRCAVAQDRRA